MGVAGVTFPPDVDVVGSVCVPVCVVLVVEAMVISLVTYPCAIDVVVIGCTVIGVVLVVERTVVPDVTFTSFAVVV